MLALGQLDDFGEVLALGEGGDDQARFAQLVQVFGVGLVAVAVAFGDGVAVNLVGEDTF